MPLASRFATAGLLAVVPGGTLTLFGLILPAAIARVIPTNCSSASAINHTTERTALVMRVGGCAQASISTLSFSGSTARTPSISPGETCSRSTRATALTATEASVSPAIRPTGDMGEECVDVVQRQRGAARIPILVADPSNQARQLSREPGCHVYSHPVTQRVQYRSQRTTGVRTTGVCSAHPGTVRRHGPDSTATTLFWATVSFTRP